ncbi:membrane protein insertion efficiency factor YidD [Alkalihalobacterium alkalinitrilicum]|uniref:membrane protein insertion efficiency factor YidD n=1 Tax=Alkalihalobacterium alkalinitrilicum TaxID=427920 RepID=UPI0009959221
MIKSLIITSIKVYQKWISPRKSFKMKCRFYPTCSQYAILSIQKYGVIKGFVKMKNRLKRCRPDNFDSCIDYP